MLMAVDIGNTQTVLGLFDGEEVREHWRITTEAHRTADELGAVSAGLLQLRGLGLEQVDALIVSSVVPVLNRSYKNLAEKVLEVPFYQVTATMQTGLKNRYDDPGAVGADRIVNAVAAGRYYGYPTIIVDFGTATTVCAVDAEGAYRGGAILPGLYVALDALVAQTSKLPGVDLEEEPPKAIATNTPDSIRSGFIYGYAGAIDALVRRMSEELAVGTPANSQTNVSNESSYDSPEGLCVLATGGPAPAIVRHCREIDTLDPDLTLKGLSVLYELNAL
ncbi:MAG: Pantothenate kinase type III, CoaX-like [uncultured Rubrobacteraceae bacterium]|uniref:Type III pantothenate kinase n=1 Tax=uncultured Rubrobacteraceae bacterium TaxID=349277 RepID=A0A6J4PY43_9ACTN|nr:MAG: Pantothenate kinase type III, CoaX-like [uncultured Rubrobacteraceae bacterium]